jgi:predicted nucleotidyltransferase
VTESSQLFIDLAQRFTEELKERWGDNLISVILYGAVPRGESQTNSDIDLLVIGEQLPLGAFARSRLLKESEEALKGEVAKLKEKGLHPYFSFVVKTREEAGYHSPLYLDMTMDARILYDKEDCFAEILKGMRERMKELGARRVYLKDGWYWDLKPDYQFGEIFEI